MRIGQPISSYLNDSVSINSGYTYKSLKPSKCIAIGPNIELPDGSNNLVVIGNIKLTTENILENAIYVGGGDEMKVFFQNGNKFVDIMEKLNDLEEKVTQLMYAPPGEGGPLYNDAKRSFDKHAKKLKRSQTDTRARSNSL